jgi:hypothetical protein
MSQFVLEFAIDIETIDGATANGMKNGVGTKTGPDRHDPKMVATSGVKLLK